MDYMKLGNSGLDVSRICLGCMSFGTGEGWVHNQWALDETDSRAIVKRALDLGVNFFDTANVYAYGTSEAFLGRALKDYANRDEIAVATKVRVKMREGANGEGLSRKAILSEIDKSLKRLGMDYVDLYIIHRWDYHTPIEETMEALHDVVKAGKARYIGASAMFAWQFMKALAVADQHGWTRFVSMQNHYNLIYREEEREMMPLCRDQKIASTPYSPLAAGRLAREGAETPTTRQEKDATARMKYDGMATADQHIINRLGEVAERLGHPRSQIALAWLLHKEAVVSPVIGATKISHLESAVQSLAVKLSAEDIAYLQEPYIPHPVVGAS